MSAGLQLAEELAGAPVDRDNPLRVEDLPDVRELLASAGPLAAVTSLALTGAGVCLVLLGIVNNQTTNKVPIPVRPPQALSLCARL